MPKKKLKSKSRSRRKVPGSGGPPVFEAPPNPPNPSIAPSEKDDYYSVPSNKSSLRTPNSSLGSLGTSLSSSDESAGSVSSDDDSCEEEEDHGEVMITQAELPVELQAYLGNKFAATSFNGTEIRTPEDLVEKIKKVMETERKYTPVEGLTAHEANRYQFLSYLKSTGFITAISKVLLSLYNADPFPPSENLTEFICDLLGYDLNINDDISEAKAYNEMLKIRIQRLQVENDWLHRRLDDFECTETPIDYLDPDFFDPKLNDIHRHPDPVPIGKRVLRRKRVDLDPLERNVGQTLQSALHQTDNSADRENTRTSRKPLQWNPTVETKTI